MLALALASALANACSVSPPPSGSTKRWAACSSLRVLARCARARSAAILPRSCSDTLNLFSQVEPEEPTLRTYTTTRASAPPREPLPQRARAAKGVRTGAKRSQSEAKAKYEEEPARPRDSIKAEIP